MPTLVPSVGSVTGARSLEVAGVPVVPREKVTADEVTYGEFRGLTETLLGRRGGFVPLAL